MSQPKWEYLANLGDVDFIEHGGVLVYQDTTGVYQPEMEIVIPPEEWEKKREWTVHRVMLEKCYLTDGILSDNKFHLNHPVWWWHKDAEHKQRHGYDQYHNFCSIAEGINITPEAFEQMFCSDDVVERARGYRELGEYHGWANFDDYPITFSGRDIRRRYQDLLDPANVKHALNKYLREISRGPLLAITIHSSTLRGFEDQELWAAVIKEAGSEAEAKRLVDEWIAKPYPLPHRE